MWWLIANGRTIPTASRASTYCCPLLTNWCVKDKFGLFRSQFSHFHHLVYIPLSSLVSVCINGHTFSTTIGREAERGAFNAGP